MTRKNKTKGKRGKHEPKEVRQNGGPSTSQEPLQLAEKEDFLKSPDRVILQYAERHFNEENRQNYEPPESRIALPKPPKCAELDEEKQADLFEEIEKLTYPLPTTSVDFTHYEEYRKLIKMHGVKTDEELISIMQWNIEWIETVAEYVIKLENEISRGFDPDDSDFTDWKRLRMCRETYMALRKRHSMEEDLMRTRRYMTNYLAKKRVEEILEEPYLESVEKYLEDHPSEAKWMVGFTRALYFSDYARFLPYLFSSPTVHYESKLLAKYGDKIDKNLLIEADMIRYERDRMLEQMSICRRWLVARMVAQRPKYLTGGLERYLSMEPNALLAVKLKTTFQIIGTEGLEVSAKLLSMQLKDYVFRRFKTETGVDYSDIHVGPEDTPEEVEKKQKKKQEILKKYDSPTMEETMDAIMELKDVCDSYLPGPSQSNSNQDD